MKLIVIRHGETNYNLKNWCNSRPDPKVRLTTLGRVQAKAAAEKLKNDKIDIIFISQLNRSRQTALILNRYHRVPMIKDKRLNDRGVGQENKPVQLFYDWLSKQDNPWTCTPRGGESYEQLKKRVFAFLKDLQRTKYKTVLIVSHLPVIKVIRGYFKDLPNELMDKPTEVQIPNCKIIRFNLKTK